MKKAGLAPRPIAVRDGGSYFFGTTIDLAAISTFEIVPSIALPSMCWPARPTTAQKTATIERARTFFIRSSSCAGAKLSRATGVLTSRARVNER